MKIFCLVFASFVLVVSASMADNWDLARNSLRLGIAEVDWTIDNGWTAEYDYQGAKLLLGADLVFDRIDQPVNENKSMEQLNFMFDAHLQFGNYQDRLDYSVLAFTYRAYQINRNLLSSRSFQIVRDQLELGKLIIGYDYTLNVDYYAELEAARVGRFWSYRPSDNSSFTFTVGINTSLGWAWVDSVDQIYPSVSNPVLGLWNVLVLEHDMLGQIYVDRRVKNGFNLGTPNQTNSREGNLRFGYRKDFSNCMALDFFAEKRSFLVQAFDMPDQYNKTKRIGVDMICHFL